MYFIHDKWINSSMMDDIDEHLKAIQMDECHSFIHLLYLSMQSVQVLW
jgi:hypothetical protein